MKSMFQVGDYVIYGTNGACKVEQIGTMEMDGIPKDKLYYTLVPVYANGSKVFTPTDNQKVIMRLVISKDEACALIDNIKDIDTLWVSDDRRREEAYKEALRTCDCREWIKIIKTLYLRKLSRIKEGKKMTSSDQKYLHMAEENLYGELAIPLCIPKEKVEEYITKRVECLEME